jgi:hypothetical protein
MLILFNVSEWTRDGLRSVEARYGDLARLDAWLERYDAGETEPGTTPPTSAWEVAGGWWRPLDVIGVIERVTGVSPVGRVEGPALSDLDERGVCRCGCMADREEPVWFNARAMMGVASW